MKRGSVVTVWEYASNCRKAGNFKDKFFPPAELQIKAFLATKRRQRKAMAEAKKAARNGGPSA